MFERNASDRGAESAIAAICRLPVDFHGSNAWPGPSVTDLVRGARYARHQASITARDLEAYLRAHPGLVRDWVLLSENQRCTPALCLLAPDNADRTQWIVAWFPKGPRRTFGCEYEATATYIKSYLDEVIARDTLFSRIGARLWMWWHFGGRW